MGFLFFLYSLPYLPRSFAVALPLVAVLTAKVLYLTEHVKRNRNDLHSRRGLEILVAQRRRLLKYLRSQSTQRYGVLIRKLGIRAM